MSYEISKNVMFVKKENNKSLVLIFKTQESFMYLLIIMNIVLTVFVFFM